MKDVPVPVEALNDVLPGSPWRPEHAARYNALNALLRRGEEEAPDTAAFSGCGEVTVPVCNISEETLLRRGPVEIVASPLPGKGADPLDPLLFGGPVTEARGPWGIALENIAPGRTGLVQLGGIAAVRGVQDAPDRFVTVLADGKFHFAKAGRAEVLYRTDVLNDALILLGGSAAAGYDGMFAVTENFDGTLSVKGGLVKAGYGGLKPVEEATLPRPQRVEGVNYYVLLNARRCGDTNWEWRFSFAVDDNPDGGYIPGEQICWVLARLSRGTAVPFVQLWRGGMIDFESRYYVS